MVLGIVTLFMCISITPSVAVDTLNITSMPISKGNTLYVGGTGEGNYTSIQDAIDNGSVKDTVFVYNGTYYETLVVYHIKSLIGENRNTTVIDGGEVSGFDVVYISDDWVTISGFTIQNSGHEPQDAGIKLNSNYSIVTGNIIIHNEYGINLQGSDNTITGNIISDNKVGIVLRYAEDNTIMSNTISKNIKGIALVQYNSGHTILKNNFIHNIKHVFLRYIADSSISAFPIKWSQNYWGRARLLPKLLFGIKIIGIIFVTDFPFFFIFPLPWINIDWRPAKEPYDIEVVI